MITDEGSPILMDFGSAVRARIQVRTRQEALLQQDLAAEHSSMPYRAPELFDVKTNTVLDEKVDIWVRPVPLDPGGERRQWKSSRLTDRLDFFLLLIL